MLTRRGRWLVVLGAAGALLGLLRSQPRLSLLSLSVLLWVFGEWLHLRWWLAGEIRRLKCRRLVNRSTSPQGILWTERPVIIEFELSTSGRRLDGGWRFSDAVPENFRVISGNPVWVSTSRESTATWNYLAVPQGVGLATLPGVRAELTDPCDLFSVRRFIDVPQTFRVFPSFVDIDEVRPTRKRVNALPPPGIHRLQQEGMGFELLELREYVPGDPPKSIAWKVSARRDKLMTRKYESEVPVRTVLFMDRSIGTRLGGFGKRLQDQMSFVAASIARSALSAKDPVGLVLFDEAGSRRIEPGIGERHFHRLLGAMNEAATVAPPPPAKLSPALFEMVWTVAVERSPELLDRDINRVPFSLFPVLPWNRRRYERRVRIAAVLAERYGLPLTTQSQLSLDDSLLAGYSHKFLMDAGLAWIEPAVDKRGRGFHECVPRLETLAKAVTQAIARGRDNELFVILADIIDCSAEVHQLIPSLKLALARHHRVAVICPMPDFRRPGSPGPLDPRTATINDYLIRAEQTRLHDRAARLSKSLRRLGVSVSFSADRQAINLVLGEADLVRHGRLHRGRG